MKKFFVIFGLIFFLLIIVILVYLYFINPCLSFGEDWIEGESFFKKKCCHGLTENTVSFPLDEGECLYFDCPCYVCLKCGNNNCDKPYENSCNCSEDCKE
jgi:hypothetical protein